ncbi:amidase [Bordetella sp. LUAb4]|uniref:amidase n=1 Tax=Bordetella sp. LUAb4 TaxID=2843195 RepID=UPI001E39A427|nr:amidase [Bordetella sp. LUAb4]
MTRIQRDDAELHAFVWTAQAQDKLNAQAQGPLAGWTLGVKDVIDVAGMPTQAGSRALGDVPKTFDATCVAQLRAAGAVPVGKTVTAEFAFTTPGATRNPRNVDHTPGGSSSGSAAAVAAGLVDVALGTQTGGSMIRPAAYCGVVGFKPTFGRVHRGGMQVLCDSLDTVGWFTRTVAQSLEVAAVLTPDDDVSAAKQAPPRVAILECTTLGTLSPAARDALSLCEARLVAAGAVIERPDLDGDIDTLTSLHATIMRYELARGLMPVVQAAEDRISVAARDVVRVGLAISYRTYVLAQRQRATLAARWLERFSEIDFILAPSAPGEAPLGLSTTGSSVFNRMWSLLGWPCLHLPTRTGAQGMPVGVQWIGKPDCDARLLQWARSFPQPLNESGAG